MREDAERFLEERRYMTLRNMAIIIQKHVGSLVSLYYSKSVRIGTYFF